MPLLSMLTQTSPFRGFKIFGIFLFFGATMASFAGATLIWRGSFLDHLWALNARAYKQLAPFGSAAGIAFLLLGTALVFAGTGWFRRRFWGWSLSVIIIAAQVVGNLANALLGDLLRGGVGLILSLALLRFLLRSQVRDAFAKQLSVGPH